MDFSQIVPSLDTRHVDLNDHDDEDDDDDNDDDDVDDGVENDNNGGQ